MVISALRLLAVWFVPHGLLGCVCCACRLGFGVLVFWLSVVIVVGFCLFGWYFVCGCRFGFGLVRFGAVV